MLKDVTRLTWMITVLRREGVMHIWISRVKTFYVSEKTEVLDALEDFALQVPKTSVVEKYVRSRLTSYMNSFRTPMTRWQRMQGLSWKNRLIFCPQMSRYFSVSDPLLKKDYENGKAW